MRPPRRIFRRAYDPFRLARPVLAGGALLAALAVLATSGLSSPGLSYPGLSYPGLSHPGLSHEVFRDAAPVPVRVSSDAAGVAVIDGGTLRVAGQVMRLRGVDAPARGDACDGGRDCGTAAAAALAVLVRGRRVDCQVSDHGAGGRPSASCQVGGADLGRAIVAGGWARAGAGSPDMAGLEQQARSLRNGMWAAPAR